MADNKTLADWLASSDEEETTPKKKPSPNKQLMRRSTDNQSPKVNPARLQRMQEVAERRKKQEELDRKMAETLGETVVAEVQQKVTARPVSPSTSFSDDFESGPPSARVPNLGLPPTAPPFGGDTPPKRMDPGALKDHQQQSSEDYGVMLCDRGCQTATTVETQTDPDPHHIHCERCYTSFYSHPPPQHQCSAPTVAPNAYSNNTWHGSQQSHQFQSRPIYAEPTAATGQPFGNVRSKAALKQQLNFVQNAVDNIIRKYNLPPPPVVG